MDYKELQIVFYLICRRLVGASCCPGALRAKVFEMPLDQITYSEKYCDETFEFRHVILPPDIAKLVPKTHLMSETEWRNLGVQQSPGWIHFMVHSPEPHVLLFRRPLPKSERIQQQALLQHTISHGH